MVKIGRNDSCPCGSGRKYNYCCYLDEHPRIFRMEVKLESMGPGRVDSTISRTLQIEGTDSLYDLHMEFQRDFGWDNGHMFSFFLSDRIWDKRNEYSANPLGEHMPSSFGDISKPAGETEIRDLPLEIGGVFKYLFDYGDEIVHKVTFLDIFENESPQMAFPKIIQSIGKPPPQYGSSSP